MDYRPVTAVWEVTMGCNMRCKHCGSGCTHPLPDELTTGEALALCDDVAELGLQWITLSGGEPLIRADWPQLVKRLRERGVVPNLITNGWECDDGAILSAREAGIGTIAVSLDGLEDVHDFMRRPGSFARSTRALGRMGELGVTGGAITTVNRRNIGQLPELKELLIGLGVGYWQLQIGLPMGNLAHHGDLVMEPEDVDRVLAFCAESVDDLRITIYPADCLGYYSRDEIAVRRRLCGGADPPLWQGCNAGKRGFGILHNGDVLGCTSIRDREFIEGNIRETPLRALWESPDRFGWCRGMSRDKLEGHCRTCQYGDQCLGGCPNTRLTMNGSVYSENRYCSYNLALRRAEARLAGETEADSLLTTARALAADGEIQLASLTLDRLLAVAPEHEEALLLQGYASFMTGNFAQCRAVNEKALDLDPGNAYARKGLGMALHRLGETDNGLDHLRRAAASARPEDMDAYHDLIVVYLEAGRRDEARQALEAACRLAPAFARANPHLASAAQ
jgi:radical SAM protein with 4Fe4S-binding SPASM domain